MADRTRRNSPEGCVENARADLRSMCAEDLRVRGELVASGTLHDRSPVQGEGLPDLATTDRLAIAFAIRQRA